MRILAALFMLVCLTSCQQKSNDLIALTDLDFAVTTKPEAASQFEKGLLLLHSFEYADAAEEFRRAQLIDPKMAMAYWGEAMTYDHALWGEQDYDKADSVIKRMNEVADISGSSEMEQAFIDALDILFQPKTSKDERDIAYANFMEKLYNKYPGNEEVASFYALALLGSVPEGRDGEVYGKSAAISQLVLDKNPNHPGALHYRIHALDDPIHAQLALVAANNYAKVAPYASHALHMPSHIYVALGMWDEVVSSNINSYGASVARMERKQLPSDKRSYHDFHWLQYGYLQQGNYIEPRKMVWDMLSYTKEAPSKRSRTYMVMLKGTYLVETDYWSDSISGIEVEISDLNVMARSQYRFIEGMKAFKSGDKVALDSLIKKVAFENEKEALLVSYTGSKVCSNVSREEASQTDIDESTVIEYQLRALRAWLDNDDEKTEKYLLNSIGKEEQLSFVNGPPMIQKPTHELYADWLMSKNRLGEAADQYSQTLLRSKKRRRALEGVQKAS